MSWDASYPRTSQKPSEALASIRANQDAIVSSALGVPALSVRSQASPHIATVFMSRSGQTPMARLFGRGVGTYEEGWLTANLLFDGTNWQRDDTTQVGWAMGLSSADVFVLSRVAAGANPAVLTTLANINNVGTLTMAGGVITTNLVLLNAGGGTQIIQSENGVQWGAKNSVGTVEQFLIPRYTDNITYLNFGSAGFKVRTNAVAEAMVFAGGGDVDVAFSTAFLRGDLAITGNTNNGTTPARRYVRLTGTPVAFNLTGLTGGRDGREIIIQNQTGVNCTLTNNDTANSTAANCFLLKGAASYVLANGACVHMIYDSGNSRWVQVIG